MDGGRAPLGDRLVDLLARGAIEPEQPYGARELQRALTAAGVAEAKVDAAAILEAAAAGRGLAGVALRAEGRRVVLALDASTRGTITIHRGDNLEVLPSLADASIDLIYIDPPFNTGRPQSRVSLRTERDDEGDRQGFRGLRYRTIKIGRRSFADAFDDYLAFLAPRLEEAHRLLRPTGSLLLHLDYREVHYAKVLLDQIFGRDAFLNEIIWAYDYGARATRRWSPKHDNILWYARDPRAYTFEYDAIDRIPYMAPGLVGAAKAARGKTPTDTWWHTIVSPSGREKTGYPTQKPLGVIGRLVRVHSRRGDTLLDFFAGSGTLGEAAALHGRHAILIDQSPEAEAVMRRRLARFLGEGVGDGASAATDASPGEGPGGDEVRADEPGADETSAGERGVSASPSAESQADDAYAGEQGAGASQGEDVRVDEQGAGAVRVADAAIDERDASASCVDEPAVDAVHVDDARPADEAHADAAPLDAAPLDAAPLDAAPLDAASLDEARADPSDAAREPNLA
ncbi:MAG: site-specific DNA-methyltransferase [Nannocystaceae bacterium]